jgi:hypothetical protein
MYPHFTLPPRCALVAGREGLLDRANRGLAHCAEGVALDSLCHQAATRRAECPKGSPK